jgi:hypothetical protein
MILLSSITYSACFDDYFVSIKEYFCHVNIIFWSTWRIFYLHGKNILERFFVAHKNSIHHWCSHAHTIIALMMMIRGRCPSIFVSKKLAKALMAMATPRVSWLIGYLLVGWLVGPLHRRTMMLWLRCVFFPSLVAIVGQTTWKEGPLYKIGKAFPLFLSLRWTFKSAPSHVWV